MGVQKRLPPRPMTALSAVMLTKHDVDRSDGNYDLDEDDEVRRPLGVPASSTPPISRFLPTKKRKSHDVSSEELSQDSENIGGRVKRMKRSSTARKSTLPEKPQHSSLNTRTRSSAKASNHNPDRATASKRGRPKQNSTGKGDRPRRGSTGKPGRPRKKRPGHHIEEQMQQLAEPNPQENTSESSNELFVAQDEEPSHRAGNAAQDAEGPENRDPEVGPPQLTAHQNAQDNDSQSSRESTGSPVSSDNEANGAQPAEQQESQDDQDHTYNPAGETADQTDEAEEEEGHDEVDEMTRHEGLDAMDDSRLYGQVAGFKEMLEGLGKIGVTNKNGEEENRRGELRDLKDGEVKDVCEKCEKTKESVAHISGNQVNGQDEDNNSPNENERENLTMDATAFIREIRALAETVGKFSLTVSKGHTSLAPEKATRGIYAHVYPAIISVLTEAVVAYDRSFGHFTGSERWRSDEQFISLEAILTQMSSILKLFKTVSKAIKQHPGWKPSRSPPLIKPISDIIVLCRSIYKVFKREYLDQKKRRSKERDRLHAAETRARVLREEADERLAETWRTLRISRALVEPDSQRKHHFTLLDDEEKENDMDDDDDDDGSGDRGADGSGEDGSVYDEHGERGERVSMFGAQNDGGDGDGDGEGRVGRRRAKHGRRRRAWPAWTDEETCKLVEALEKFWRMSMVEKERAAFIGPGETHPFQYVFRQHCAWDRERRCPGVLREKDALEIVQSATEFRAYSVREAEATGEVVPSWIQDIPVIRWKRGL